MRVESGVRLAIKMQAYKGSYTFITSHFSERSSITTASKTALDFSTSCRPPQNERVVILGPSSALKTEQTDQLGHPFLPRIDPP